MSRYRLEIRPSVEKTLKKIRDQQLQQRLGAAFEKLSENPRRPGAEKMSGFQNRYRFRVGGYRVVYEIHDAVLLVLILAVGDRKDIYRQMTSPAQAKPLVWITGAGGFIGSYLVQTAGQCAPGWQVRALGRPEFDLLDFTAVETEFRKDQPQLIIHCAAVSSVAEARDNPALTQKLNVDATRLLAGLAENSSFVFFSTDLVFDGRQGNYRETDAVGPLHLYGESKAAAEQIVLANPRHLVLRTSINGGSSKTGNRGFNEQLRTALQNGRGMTLFTDEYRSPIPVPVTTRVLWELVYKQCTGLFHVGGAEKLSRWRIGQLLVDRWPELRDKLNDLKPGSAKDFPGPPRVLDASLDISRVQSILSAPVPGLSEWLAANPHEPF